MIFNEIINIIEKAKKNGYKEIPKIGSKLYGSVPHVAPDAWFHVLYSPLKDKEIFELEKKINIEFPKYFIDFLKFSNGINLFSNEIAIYGLRKNYIRMGDEIWQPFDIELPNTIERLKDSKDSYLFIGSYFYDGSKLFINCKDNKVYRCASKKSSVKLNSWGNFNEMLISEVKRLETIFNENGVLIEPNEPTTPIPNI